MLANAPRVLGPQTTLAEHTRFAYAVLDSFYEFVMELGENAGSTRERWLRLLDGVEGIDGYERARSGKKGAIFATAHLGSFEVGAMQQD